MRNQKGVTLVFLMATITILIILAGITTTTSISLYKKMRYENFIAQLEEIQGAVDKMCEKYEAGDYTSFSDNITGFFAEVYGSTPGTLAIAENANKANEIIDKYFGGNSSYHEGFVFYFYATQMEEYFNLNGIKFDVVIDFSTRYVYSVNGCANPKDEIIIYSLIDLKKNNIKQQDETILVSNASGITFTQVLEQSGTTKMYKINLVLNYSEDKGDYNIYKAYYSTDNGAKWNDVSYLGDCEYLENSVSFYIYESGTYYFKIQDTSGKVISNIQGSVDSVYTTINF